jgi:serine/threonine protein kinase
MYYNVFPLADLFAPQRVCREAYILMQLDHEHIIPLEGVTVAEEFGPLPALVSPWMEEGSLDAYLNREFSGLSDPQKQQLVSAK